MEQCLVTGGDKPTPVVTWLIRLLPRRGAVVALILSDVHGSEGVSSRSKIGGPKDIFRFSQQLQVLENTATDYVHVRQVTNKLSHFKNLYYYSVSRLQSFCPCLGKPVVKAYQLTYRVIHKSLRDFQTRLRNNQDKHGRKGHINRYRVSTSFFCTRGLGVLPGSTAIG